jgi:UDP-N-acetylmuramoyl-L-alanyl-D-glutamate--2,6-diaminopimelate ligase
MGQAPLVVVAGSYGKSLCGFLLQHILERAGDPGPGRYFENLPPGKTAPLMQQRSGWSGLEISPAGLHRGLYRGLSFDLGILTNLYPARCRIPRTRYLALHRNFFAAAPENSVAVVNADDPPALETLDVAGGKAVTFALGYPRAMVTAEQLKPLPMGSLFQLVIRGELPRLGLRQQGNTAFPVRLGLPGKAGVYTALAAAAAALVLGAGEEAVAQGLKTFPGLPRRLEFLPAGDILLVDDTAPGSLALRFLLDSLTALRIQRIFLVLGMERGGREGLAAAARELLAQEDRHPLAEIYLSSCSEFLPAKDKASRLEEKAFLETWRQGAGRAPVAVLDSLTAALQEVALSLKGGDLVLLLGGRGMNDAGSLLSLHLREGAAYPVRPFPPEEAAGSPLGLWNPT